MSSNRAPSKIKVYSSGPNQWGEAGGAPADGKGEDSGRRRGDSAQGALADAEAPRPGDMLAGDDAPSGALLWVALGVVLFVIGCAIGGALVTISLLYPGKL